MGPSIPAAAAPSGDAVLSLLSLQYAQQATDAESTKPAPVTTARAGKENQIPASWSERQMSHDAGKLPADALVYCSPQKHRLLMGRLQSPSKAGSPGVSNRVAAAQQQSPPQKHPVRHQLQRPSQAQIPPTVTSPVSPSRRTIRPTRVLEPAAAVEAGAQVTPGIVAPVPVSSSAAVPSVPRSCVSPPSEVEASLLTSLPRPASPHGSVPPAQPRADGPSSASSPAQRCDSSRASEPLQLSPNAHAAADILLAEHLLRARAAGQTASVNVTSVSGGYTLTVASLTNTSSQSSCTAVARSSSSSAPRPPAALHGFTRLPPPCRSFSLAPAARSAPSSAPSKLGTVGPGSFALHGRSTSLSSSSSYRGGSRGVSVCIKPLEQILIKAQTLTNSSACAYKFK